MAFIIVPSCAARSSSALYQVALKLLAIHACLLQRPSRLAHGLEEPPLHTHSGLLHVQGPSCTHSLGAMTSVLQSSRFWVRLQTCFCSSFVAEVGESPLK